MVAEINVRHGVFVWSTRIWKLENDTKCNTIFMTSVCLESDLQMTKAVIYVCSRFSVTPQHGYTIHRVAAVVHSILWTLRVPICVQHL